MRIDLRRLCFNGLTRFIGSGIFPRYCETGRFDPSKYRGKRGFQERDLIVLHYAELRGPLYRDTTQWQRVQSFVHGFTAPGQGITQLTMPDPWGTIAADFATMKSVLPGAFQVLGMNCASSDPGGRHWLFRAEGGTRMEGLPEPYGKWYQHKMKRPRWGQNTKLHLEVNCVLSFASPQTTSLDFEISAFAPSIVSDLGRALSLRLGLSRRLYFAGDYLQRRARFRIKSEPISLLSLN
jgi:hypothetical protein